MSNHVVGLVSLSAADEMLDNVRWFCTLLFVAIILYASLFIHAGLGVLSTITKYSYRIKFIDWVQIGTGLLIPWIPRRACLCWWLFDPISWR